MRNAALAVGGLSLMTFSESCGSTNQELPSFPELALANHQQALVVAMKQPTEPDPFEISRALDAFNGTISNYLKRALQIDTKFAILGDRWQTVPDDLRTKSNSEIQAIGNRLIPNFSRIRSTDNLPVQTLLYIATHGKEIKDYYFGGTSKPYNIIFAEGTSITIRNDDTLEHELVHSFGISGHDQQLSLTDPHNFEDLTSFILYGGDSLMGNKKGFPCAFVRYALDKLPRSQIKSIAKNNNRQTISLEHMQSEDHKGSTKVVRIPLPNGRAYWIELVNMISFYDSSGLQMRVTDENPQHDTFQIVNQKKDSKTGKLVPQMQFSENTEIYDNVNGVHVKLLHYTNQRYDGAEVAVWFD